MNHVICRKSTRKLVDSICRHPVAFTISAVL